MKPQVEKIFNDLEKYLDVCRFELREFNPAHLYDKSNYNYRAFLNSRNPKFQKNRNHNNNYNNNNRKAHWKK